jgi:hypothetical protein
VRRTVTPYAVAGLALVAALVLLVLGTAPPSQNDDPSSRVAGRAGTLALHDWLGGLGFTVHRVAGHFDTSATDVLLMVDPRTTVGTADADAVMALLARGGDLVLAVSPQSALAAAPLLDRLRVSMTPTRGGGDSTPSQPFDAGDRVHRVPTRAAVAIDRAPYLTPLLTQEGALTAVAERVGGAGRAYVLSSPFPLSNDGLRSGDSAMLVLALLERARGGAIAFDEYHHGEADAAVDGATAVFRSPLGLALVLSTISVVAYLAVSGRRLGRPLPSGDAALVPSTAAYIGAMAGLYGRARDRGGVAEGYAQELKRRLRPGVAMEDDAAFLAAIEQARPDLAADVAAALGRARSLAGSRPSAADLLVMARMVDAVERRWSEPVPAGEAQ